MKNLSERGNWLYAHSNFCIEDCIEIAEDEEEFKYYYDRIKGEIDDQRTIDATED
tara:strand:- start:205 stop:369 length:165 start_codon:yes stop_codon:yes gene_type:complete